MKKVRLLSLIGLTIFSALQNTFSQSIVNQLVISENFGSPSATTLVNAYTGYQNTSYTFSSVAGVNPISVVGVGTLTTTNTPDVRSSFASTGYTNASGGGNVYFTSTSSTGLSRTLFISNINTSTISGDVYMTFGYTRNVLSAADLVLAYSTNGTDFFPISYTSTSTTSWQLITSVGLNALPKSNSLTLLFYKPDPIFVQYRIDDIKIYNQVLGSASITGLTFASQSGLTGPSIGTTFSGNNISVLFPNGSTLSGSSLVPTFTFSFSPTSIIPSSLAGQDFSVPVIYTIDGTNVYTITSSVAVTLSSANSITGFTLKTTTGIIMGNMINVTVPFGTNLTNLTATGSISPLATVNPSFSTIQDYSSMVLFTVTAQDLSMQVYTVTAILGPPPSDANSITGFTLLNSQIASSIDQANGIVYVTIPGAIYVESIAPISISISPKATISPAVSFTLDFHSMQTYTVTAESGLMKAYVVTVTALTIPDMIYTLTSVGVNVDEPMNTISGQYLTGWARLKGDGSPIPPNDSDHMAVVNNTTSTGYAFASGGVNVIVSNAPDFGSGIYMLTSAGYNTTNWKNLKVNWGYRKTSTFESGGGVLPTLEWSRNGTDWNLVTGYTHNSAAGWASVSPSGIPLPIQSENKSNIYFRFSVTTSGIGNGNYRLDDFYLTGDAGVNTLSGENAITAFEIANQVGLTTITGSNIYVVLPAGTPLTAVVPDLTISGLATINPLIGTPIDLSSLTGTYTVTSQAETDNVYTIHAYVLSDANQVLSLTYLPQSANGLTTAVTGSIVGTNIFVEFPIGVTITGLVPTFVVSPLAMGNLPAGLAPNYAADSTLGYAYRFGYTVTAEDGLAQPYTIRLKAMTDTTGGDTTSIASIIKDESFKIYPNPTSGSFKITKASSGLEIYNSLGAKVFETFTNGSEISLEVGTLGKGIYLVRSKKSGITKTLIVE